MNPTPIPTQSLGCLPFEISVSCRYGAPMGRQSDRYEDFKGKTHLRRVPMVDGDYDPGGAYWGGSPSAPLWCAWDDEGHIKYVRAIRRADLKRCFSYATFYR